MFNTLYKKYKDYIIISVVCVFTTLLLWSPFVLRLKAINGIQTPNISFNTVLSHWDGPLYIIPAKTLYDTNSQILKGSPLGIDPKYFAAHLPAYPLTLKLFAPFVGYPKATVMSTLLASLTLFAFFYYMVKKLQLTSQPLLLTLVFMFITPRFFVIRSIGSPEPLFLLLILVSVFFFIEKKYLFSGLAGGIAIATKTPAGLLFVAYILVLIRHFLKTKKFDPRTLWLGLIPTGLLAVFILYAKQYGDFFAYFNSGDNLHLLFPPFQVFNFQKNWVDDGWLEEILLVYLFYGTMISELWHRHVGIIDSALHPLKKEFNTVALAFGAVFLLAIISVQHRDIARYSLPLLPFALITFEKFFTTRKFLVVMALLIPAIYAYSWNFMLWNVAPITDWAPFL